MLLELNTIGVEIQVANGKISLNAPKGLLTDSLLQEVHKNKEELIRLYSLPKEHWNHKPIAPAASRTFYPLSSQQKGLFVLQQLDSESTAYNLHVVIPVPKGIDCQKLENAFRKLISRHEIMRTCFKIIDDHPKQVICKQFDASLPVYKLTIKEFDELYGRFIKPFNLSQLPLVRACLAEILDGKEDYLLMDMHHIIADGISQKILEEELWSLYHDIELPDVSLHYKDYAEWMLEDEQQRMLKKQEEYWLSVFRKNVPELSLPYDFARPVVKSFEGAEASFLLTDAERIKVMNVCKKHSLTLYMYFLSVVNILFHKLSNQTDIIIGVPTAGRRNANLAKMCGMFVNTVAIRNFPNDNKLVIDFLAEVKRAAIEAFDNEEYPFEELVDRLGVKRDSSFNPLFDVMVNVLNNIDYLYSFPYESTTLSPHISTTSKFDITFTCVDYLDKVLITINYCTKLFREDSINRIAGYLRQVITQLQEKLDMPLSSFKLLDSQQKEQLLNEFNGKKQDFNKNSKIHELFEQQVERTPDNLAITYDRQSITYAELNRRANLLARKLLLNGCMDESFIGIMMERGIEMYISILAVLKTGRGYIPIDPSLPAGRIKAIVQDSAITKLLSNNAVAGVAESCSVINTTITEKTDSLNNVNVESLSLAYIIYTSGSTGRPKGVVIRHSSVINLIKHQEREFEISSTERILQLSSFAFDASVEQMWLALFSGATLVAVPESVLLNTSELERMLLNLSVTHVHFVPAYLIDLNIKNLPDLRRIVAGGDICPVNLAKKMSVKTAYNEYGPTETTVTSVEFNIRQLRNDQHSVPVGRPIQNTNIYILNKHFQLSPIGVPGDMYISGEGLAEGYLNNIELTCCSFIQNPYRGGELMYRTGDIAKWTADGNLEFLGRSDTQVKINGFRIEPGEVEHVLLNRNDVKRCLVLPVTVESEKQLCAYVEADRQFDADELRIYLSDLLPAYMVPHYIISIAEWPYTTTGKINRNALPLLGSVFENRFVEPVNAVEKQLVGLWSAILGLEDSQVSVTTNFFELGGNSLRAAALAVRIQKEFGVMLLLKDIFTYPTVRKQGKQLAELNQREFKPLPVAEQRSYYEMTSMQKRMFLLQQVNPLSVAYNMPMIIRVPGKVEKVRIEWILQQLINRYESLRTSFTVINGLFVQRIHKNISFKDSLAVISDEPLEKVIKYTVRPFDLSVPPLMRAVLISGSDETGTVLLIDIHHIVSDGVSQSIIKKDFYTFFYNEDLKPLRLQYKDYSEWLRLEEQRNMLDVQSKYWLDQVGTEPLSLQLPIDFQRPVMISHDGATAWYSLSKEHTAVVKRLAKECSATVYMVMLAAINVLLARICNQEDIVVGTSISGRQHSDLENMVGMFVNTLVLRNKVKSKDSFRQLLLKVRELTVEAYEHQNYPFETLVEQVAKERDLSHNPLFDVFFAMAEEEANEEKQIWTDNTSAANEHKDVASKFDLSFIGIEYREEILMTITYSAKLFKAETINRFIGYLGIIVHYIVANPDRELGSLELVSKAEKNHLLQVFNDTTKKYSSIKPVHCWFEEIVDSIPDHIAVVSGKSFITYSEMNRKANELALYLRGKGVTSNSAVALFFEPSLEMIISIIGVLKAGGCYVPINTHLPQNQIDHILSDTASAFAVTTRQHISKFRGVDNVVSLDEFSFGGPCENLEKINSVEDCVYVIYTSGTTGGPKGVMIKHSNLANYISWFSSTASIAPGDRTALLTSYAFDLGYTSVYSSLLCGAELHLLGREYLKSPRAIVNILSNSYTTYLKLTPSLYSVIVNSSGGEELVKCLRLVVLGGEQIDVKEVERSIRLNNKLSVINHYGPTETTIGSVASLVNIENVEDFCQTPTIGKPVSNASVIILDYNNRMAPIGTRGELCIAGAGLAIGYLNNAVLTSEKFTANPYSDCAVLYRSGDMARWLPNGTVEFFCRLDDQVKVNGYRVELAEIETALGKHKNIIKSKVLALTQGSGKTLCAYIESDMKLDAGSLRVFLKEWLPEYVIPQFFVVLAHLPVTPNGKLDRKALPLPSFAEVDEYAAPQSLLEKELAGIWSNVLNIPENKISVTAGFFQLGGHSLKAMLVMVEIEKRLGISLSINDIFSLDTIAAISAKIENLIAENENRFLSMAESLTEEELNNLLSSQLIV